MLYKKTGALFEIVEKCINIKKHEYNTRHN